MEKGFLENLFIIQKHRSLMPWILVEKDQQNQNQFESEKFTKNFKHNADDGSIVVGVARSSFSNILLFDNLLFSMSCSCCI